jgi:Domain of unknown function (DUF397)
MTSPSTPQASGADRRAWRKSSYSGGGNNCLEVAAAGGTAAIAVRDSKNPDGGYLTFGAGAWTAFVSSIKRGQYENDGL